jgi:Neutral/alkaline non-lysosomal ceramidase, N-terminal
VSAETVTQQSSARTGMRMSVDTREPSPTDHIVLANVPETADVIVSGPVLAVQPAHTSLAPSFLALGNVAVNRSDRNRSPSTFLENPTEEQISI